MKARLMQLYGKSVSKQMKPSLLKLELKPIVLSDLPKVNCVSLLHYKFYYFFMLITQMNRWWCSYWCCQWCSNQEYHISYESCSQIEKASNSQWTGCYCKQTGTAPSYQESNSGEEGDSGEEGASGNGSGSGSDTDSDSDSDSFFDDGDGDGEEGLWLTVEADCGGWLIKTLRYSTW